MPAALLPRDEVVARILTVFRDFGFDGASLAELSKATGLGRSSLYHYFPGGKDEMAVAVLERIDTWMRERALAALTGAGTPQARLRKMLDLLDEFYVGGRNACVLEAGIRGPEAQRRAEDAVVRIEGALIVSGGLDDPAPFKRALRNVERDLLAPTG